MDNQLTLSPKFRNIAYLLMGLGLVTIVIGFTVNPDKTWSNLLVNNYYFLTLALGASFFWALQHVTQSGWSAAFIRVPQAMTNYIPVAGILMIPLLFGMHNLYEWSHSEALADPFISHKSPYLNVPFFIARFFIYFAVWIILTQWLRKLSLKEDMTDSLEFFRKSEYYSKVYIFSLAVTFTLSAFDWIMSIDAHWFSTIFAIRNFVMAFFHASAVITLIIVLLNRYGYLQFLTKAHLRDLTRYIFMLSIIWTYTWFAQYILIWYANIPEETIYYLPRTKGEFSPFFYLELVINWLVPFLLFMSNRMAVNKTVIIVVCILLMIGQWVDIYLQVIVGTYHHLQIDYIEVGSFIGFLGLFAYVTARSLTMAPLVPRHHPYLEESLQHH